MNTNLGKRIASGLMLRRIWAGRGNGARGFTLIELVIVVAIVAILAAIALPNYTQYVLRANRSQGKADMLQTAQALERWYTSNRNYVSNAAICGQTIPSPATGTLKYNLTAVCVATPPSFTITATRQGGQSQDPCGTLSLDQAGRKTYSSGTAANCAW